MNAPDGLDIDHKDITNLNNKIDNRKINLRIATSQQNDFNQPLRNDNNSGFIGISYISKTNNWRAYITVHQKRKHLGNFNNIEDAIIIRLKAEKELFGEFAPQRHLFEQYNIS